jgi:outer membrane receptor protein involved in Fe transport/outer membrane protein OmpA-like peptidoglycan-associated protein
MGSASLLLVPAASAQSVAAASGASTAHTGLEEITVTARKKSENLQKAPLSITAISKKTIQESHIQDFHDIGFLTPGINVVDYGSEVGTAITIRGVTDLTYGVNVPDVATFLDGVYLREPAAIEVAAPGLERIEVVKNPTSAQYGRDAYTGVINYIIERPTSEPKANLEYTVGNYGKEQVVGNVSGPIWGDMVFGKIFGQFDNFDGTWKDSISGAKAGGDIKKDIGGLLDFKWNANLSSQIDAYYGYDFFNNDPIQAVPANCGDIASGGIFGLYCGRIPTGTHVDVGNDPAAGNPGNERRTFLGSIRNTASYDWGKIDSVTGATQIDQEQFGIFDASATGLPYEIATAANPYTPIGTVPEHEWYGGANKTGNFSEELRYTSPKDQRARFGFGGYYYRERRIVISAASLAENNVPAGDVLCLCESYGLFPVWETPTGAPGPNINVAHQLTVESSLFGSAEFDILPNLTASAEYRYTDLLQQFVAVRNQYDGATIDPLGPHISQTNQYFNNFDTLSWAPIPTANLYVNFANGTKPGGFNGASTVVADEAFGPETDKSFEGGAKTMWLDNRLRFNVAAYHVETENTQAYGPSSDPKNAATVIKNFGASSNTGFEIDASGKPTDNTTITLGGDYNNPTFSNSSYDLADSSYCIQIPSCAATLVTIKSNGDKEIPIGGRAVPYSPKITVSLTGEYDYEFMDIYKGYVRANYSYHASESADPAGLNSIGPSSNLDLYTGISRGPYSLGAYVKNVTDNRVPVNFQYEVQLVNFLGIPAINLPPGRTFAVTFGVHFGGPAAPMPSVEPPPPPAAPAPAPQVEAARTYLVFFDWDRADLTERARQIVATAAAASTHVQTTRIEVNGYTDLSGTPTYNQKLSVRRAEAVESELVRDGVSKQEIAIHGYGESNPLVPTAKGVREPQNRRVEIILK